MKATKNAPTQSIDDFDLVQLQNMIDEVQHEVNLENEKLAELKANGEDTKEDSSDTTSVNSQIALFDKLLEKEDKELDDSVSSVVSSNSFRSMSTRKSKLTVLNQKAYA